MNSIAGAAQNGWVHGKGANLNGVRLDHLLHGFGDRLVWEFSQGESRHTVSSLDIVHGGKSVETAPNPLREDLEALRQEHGLAEASFVTLWVTPDWQPGWYPPRDLQAAIDEGLTPVFLDWYFGDDLLRGNPRSDVPPLTDDYARHSRRFGRFLGQFDGDILVVVEPEMNKPSIEQWPEFGQVIRDYGIAEIHAGIAEINQTTGRNTNIFFGVALNDNGLRNADIADDKYGTKAKGDSFGWQLSRPLLEVLRPDLDFVGFQQILAQFHRDPENPEKPKANLPGEIGLEAFPERVLNYSRWLQEQLGIPILIPYIGMPTSTWKDGNGNGLVDPGEVEELGWQAEVGTVLNELRQMRDALFDAGVFGLGTMMLFDDPIHDLGGYQYLLDNEYSLGLIATDAQNGREGETFNANIHLKRLEGGSFGELFFGSPSFVELLFKNP